MRALLSILGLSFTGAALGSGLGPAVLGLGTGVAGNMASEILKGLDRRRCDRFVSTWPGRKTTPVVLQAFRTAQLNALGEVLARYESLLPSEDDHTGERRGYLFHESLSRFLKKEAAHTRKRMVRAFEEGPVNARLAESFEATLGDRETAAGPSAVNGVERLRALAEQAVLAEVSDAAGGTDEVPPLFLHVFHGEDQAPAWHELFVAAAAAALTHSDSGFAHAWAAEQTALIRALVAASHTTIEATHATVRALARQLDAGVVSLDRVEVHVSAVREEMHEIRSLLSGLTVEQDRRARPTAAHELPAPPADFVGRHAERDALVSDLRSERVGIISAVRGMGGIGKTTLAAVVGRDVSAEYPDGHLWVNMKGSRPDAIMSAFEAMGRVIHQIDVLVNLAPDEDSRAAQFRTSFRDRKILLVLDDARDGAHVAGMIPPPPSALLITSRRTFALPGMRPIELPPLSEADALTLLLGIAAGAGRTLEPGDAEEIVAHCGRLPLAIRAAGSFLAENRDWAVAEYLSRLRAERTRLDVLTAGDADLDVRAVLGFSYRQLSDDDPLLAGRWVDLHLVPGKFDVAAAASIWGCSAEEAKDDLSSLVRRAMLEFDEETGRYRFHDLMRAVAEAEAGEPRVVL